MLERVILLKNVGKFHGCAAGNIPFEKLTLIFGSNGAGKTTLCDVLRSLALGSPDYLLGRKRLSATNPPEVTLRISQTNHAFTSNGWSSTFPDLQVFDKTYIHDNVFSGDHVFHDHKKKLYHVILGETGTTLARRIEEIAKEISDLNRTIGELKTTVQASVPAGTDVSVFVALPKLDDLDSQITEKRSEVAALAQGEAIKIRPKLSAVTLPTLSLDIEQLLAKTVASLSTEAEARVREHVSAHLDHNGEGWLADGLKYAEGGDCPFCGRSLNGIELIGSFRAFFSEAYSSLKAELGSARKTIDAALGESSLLALQRAVTTNRSHWDFWSAFVKNIELPGLDFTSDIQPALASYRDALHGLVAKKKLSPLDPIAGDEALQKARSAVQAVMGVLDEYNQKVAHINSLVDGIKTEISAGNVANAKKELAILEATKVRHSSPASENCARYQEALDRKKKLEEEKDAAKEQLEKYSTTVCKDYQEAINGLLVKFGSGFQLEGTQHQYVGGSPSSTFQLKIDGVSIDVGDERTPLSKPSFRNTLSSGDRATLALAFFVVQLERDPRLAEKIVVFDDPFTSQDEYRRTVTQHLILRFAGKAKQVIVLSHDVSFLRNLYDECPKKTVGLRCLQMRREKSGTGLHLFDIEQATASDYYVMYRKLSHFRDENIGDPFDIAKTVRPFMECWIKLQCPGNNFGSMMLGQILSEIENADASSDLAQLQSDLQELQEINSYSTQFHHADKPLAPKPQVNESELLAFVSRTLNLR